MAFSTLTLAETAAKALIRQALWRKVKDNFDDLDSRVLAVESATLLFDHFNGPTKWGTLATLTGTASPGTQKLRGEHGPWLYQVTDDAENFPGGNLNDANYNPTWPSFSVARIAMLAGTVRWAALVSKMKLRFNQVVLPITFEGRFKVDADGTFFIGINTTAMVYLSPDAPGIWLERVDASNWRFVSYDTARNNGTSFAKPTLGAFFSVKIVFHNSPSNQALCYVNDVLKETLSTQLPLAQDLGVALSIRGATDINLDADRILFKALGIADAP